MLNDRVSVKFIDMPVNLIIAKGFSISKSLTSYNSTNITPNFVCIIQLIVIHSIFFVGALVASLRGHCHSCNDIALPKGMAKCIVNISFCFTCFCCCVCCSGRCRAKTLQVLVLFSFMTFIFHSIMDAIAIGFILFDDESRATTVTVTMLYISLIMFLVAFVSFSLFLLKRGRSVLNCFCGVFMLITVFAAVMLLIVMYMIIFFSLNLTGFRGIVTGLIPSIALSAGSWYIKKRLEKAQAQSNNPSTQSQYGATGGAVNDVLTKETSLDTNEHTRLLD